MKRESFEEFLEAQFSENFTGSKDGWEVSLDYWYSTLDTQEVIDMGEEYGHKMYNLGVADTMKKLEDQAKDLVDVKIDELNRHI